MSDTSKLQDTLYEAAQILERARLIVSGAPFWQSADDEEFAKIVIDGEKATLFWPEVHSGYHAYPVPTHKR
jgi:hypothetical protein